MHVLVRKEVIKCSISSVCLTVISTGYYNFIDIPTRQYFKRLFNSFRVFQSNGKRQVGGIGKTPINNMSYQRIMKQLSIASLTLLLIVNPSTFCLGGICYSYFSDMD